MTSSIGALQAAQPGPPRYETAVPRQPGATEEGAPPGPAAPCPPAPCTSTARWRCAQPGPPPPPPARRSRPGRPSDPGAGPPPGRPVRALARPAPPGPPPWRPPCCARCDGAARARGRGRPGRRGRRENREKGEAQWRSPVSAGGRACTPGRCHVPARAPRRWERDRPQPGYRPNLVSSIFGDEAPNLAISSLSVFVTFTTKYYSIGLFLVKL